MANLSVSKNPWNNLIKIASTILLNLILGPWERTYLPFMRPMTERQFILAVHFIFPVVFLPRQRTELFLT